MSLMGSEIDRPTAIFWTVFTLAIAAIFSSYLLIVWVTQPSEPEIKIISSFTCEQNVCTITTSDNIVLKFKENQ